MLKLYKRHANQLHYWEYWETRPKHGVIHWGIAGERGERKDIKAPSVAAFQALLDEQTAAKRQEGFAEPTKEYDLIIEYPVKRMTAKHLDKLVRLEERLDQLLGWAGLGHCDGHGHGFGMMDISCVVVDFELAKRLIEAELEYTEFARYSSISLQERDDEEQED